MSLPEFELWFTPVVTTAFFAEVVLLVFSVEAVLVEFLAVTTELDSSVVFLPV